MVGYRRLPDNMSSNTDQMIRSGMLAVNKALSECRHIPGLSADSMLKRYELRRLRTRIRDGHLREGLWPFARQMATSPAFVADALWAEVLTLASKVKRFAARTLRGSGPLPHFYDLDPMDGIDLHHSTATSRALRKLAKLDRAYRPSERSAGSQVRATDALDVFDSRDLPCSCTYQKG